MSFLLSEMTQATAKQTSNIDINTREDHSFVTKLVIISVEDPGLQEGGCSISKVCKAASSITFGQKWRFSRDFLTVYYLRSFHTVNKMMVIRTLYHEFGLGHLSLALKSKGEINMIPKMK